MKTPVYLWIVALLAVVWNAFGTFDYVMTKTKNAGYMGQFTPEQLDYFYSFPLWVNICWPIAVWSALIASLLLLIRSRHAVPLFALSFFMMLATTVHNYGLAEVKMTDVTGQGSLVLAAVIFVIALFLWLFSRSMRQHGVLS